MRSCLQTQYIARKGFLKKIPCGFILKCAWKMRFQRSIMKSFGVSKEKQMALEFEMKRLGIREEDIEETFTRSSGPGGQNVNKLATCVYLRHRPSGIAVKVARERSQALNRFLARRSLTRKIATHIHGEDSMEAKKAQKARKQKKRRKRKTARKLAGETQE